MELLTADEMRRIEGAAIESGVVSGWQLMRAAGEGAVAAVFARFPELAASSYRAVVLCGPGNNGGDGFVMARVLRGWGWEVAVYLLGDAERLPPDARRAFEAWEGPVAPLDQAQVRGAQLVVDAVFGTGLTRGLPEGLTRPLAEARAAGAYIVAVDVPSGLDPTTGAADPATVPADLTASFHREKLGHVIGAGPELSGDVVVIDIGLGDDLCGTRPAQSAAPDADRLLKRGGHKYDHGHALIVAGGGGKGGAARLAARAALRVGAGLVTLAPTPGAMQENAARLDAVMLTPVSDAVSLEMVLADKRLNSLALGPGMGRERARELVPVAAKAGRALVLDADALTAFEDAPETLFATLPERCVLTPHGGEFARLFPDLARDWREGRLSKPEATREAATRAGAVVLLKGEVTVVAAPDGALRVHSATGARAVPWLATAGAGDVLTGLICGLMARGFGALEAAENAVWLHAKAAQTFGPGLISEDLPEKIPQVFKELGAQG